MADVELAALPTDPVTDGCPWDAVYADCGGECEAFALYDDPAAAQALWEAIASDLLWNWTGRVFGVCEAVVRPCGAQCVESSTGWSTYWGRGPGYDPLFPGGGPRGGIPFYPVLVAGQWFNMVCGCVGFCQCTPAGPEVISLPGPVQSVTEVRIDGAALPPESYRLERKRWLIRTDGGVWPRCQNMLADPATDLDTFEVTYQRGIPVPIGGQVAAGRLACELALAACGSEECALPERMTTITRQGVTVGFADTYEDLKSGGTGIYSIDTWVASTTKPIPYASVKSVDTMRR
jgi:hypothetical protein